MSKECLVQLKELKKVSTREIIMITNGNGITSISFYQISISAGKTKSNKENEWTNL